MMYNSTHNLLDEILTFLGPQNDVAKNLIAEAQNRIFDGVMVNRAVWGENLIIPDSILQTIRQRKLILVTFYRTSDSYAELANEQLVFLPEGLAVRELKQSLEERGLRLHRLARIVAAENDSDAFLLRFLDKEAMKRAPTFVSVAQSSETPHLFPVLGNKGVTWKEVKEPSDSGLLLPIIKNGRPVNGPDAVEVLVNGLHMARRINIGPRADSSVWQKVLDTLVGLRDLAKNNVRDGIELLSALSHEFRGCIDSLFDGKSGAIYFDPHTWRNLEQNASAASESKRKLLLYFQKKLPDAWSPTHPCYMRILWTPTKVLLRGEAYYVNMRRLSPFKRFELILDEMNIIKGLIDVVQPDLTRMAGDDSEWKLMLALLDQVRNISLQTFSFLHEATSIFSEEGKLGDELRGLWGDRGNKAHGFLRLSIHAYYSWLLGQAKETAAAVTEATRSFSGIADDLREIAKKLCSLSEQKGMSQSERLKDLVRGWREADHPGENLLTAVIAAARFSQEETLCAVGIGWGGIELPLVFDYVGTLRAPTQTRQVFIAKYSHYRAEERPPQWSSFPIAGVEPSIVFGKTVALFDDNTLTGITLERIRDELILRGALSVHMFITRYSGERRLHHMQMTNHGVIDPDFLAQEVSGYLGETPFARSWSSKDYKNQIGVFSLARRRILECIYNNSTVELYDREGF